MKWHFVIVYWNFALPLFDVVVLVDIVPWLSKISWESVLQFLTGTGTYIPRDFNSPILIKKKKNYIMIGIVINLCPSRFKHIAFNAHSVTHGTIGCFGHISVVFGSILKFFSVLTLRKPFLRWFSRAELLWPLWTRFLHSFFRLG